MSNRNWRIVLGGVAVGIAIILGQSDVTLEPIVKLALTVAAGVIAFIKAPENDPE